MQKLRLLSLALASALFVPATLHAQYADSVVAYTPGTGVSASFTNATSALGAPSVTVNPFSPAFAGSQLVSVGAGGSLTLHLGTSITDDAAHPYGLDFIIFGNSFFTITNGNFSGGGITSGAIGGNNPGPTKVEVSSDGLTWYGLSLALAPSVDGLFPTEGSGSPQLPVNPALTPADFAGLGLSGIRSLYNGSAGGTGFDLAWARDGNGNNVALASASFLRIGVESGKSEIDAVAVVPEPTSMVLFLSGVALLCLFQRKNVVSKQQRSLNPYRPKAEICQAR
jgi:hypothetical protein